ncbi:MAG: hypothetical protein Q9159_002723 [Coniocarpon cinnabarinum]
MAPKGRTRDIVASRRRRADDGEEDDTASLDDESQSDASAVSGANDSLEEAASEFSGHAQQDVLPGGDRSPPKKKQNGSIFPSQTNRHNSQTDDSRPAFTATADTAALTNGLHPPSDTDGAGPLQFEEPENNESSHRRGRQAFVDENRVQQRSAKPVPRVTTTASHDPQRSSRRKGRESSGFAYSASQQQGTSTSTNERWNHDLHDLLENDGPGKQLLPIVEDIPRRFLPTYSSSAKGPEPLSRTVTIGHITLRISLPGMSHPIPYEKTPLRYHIRLPDLRPPLRRDKPVRVSLPDQSPRYIFPSVERSFIFIPRAQRPNQQTTRRPFGSRRNSILGGSSYSPSIAMSRRSSVVREGIVSPAAAAMAKPPFGAPTAPSRPVVKLPVGARPHMPLPNGMSHATAATTDGMSEQLYPTPGKPAYQSPYTGQIPVHQPRPQKTVSVTNIESPSTEKLHAPQQHEHQPFYHQVPSHVNHAKLVPEHARPGASFAANQFAGTQPTGTPAHLPDNAVNAQPFQPDQSAMYYSAPYPMQDMMYYPPPENGPASYMSQPMMASQMYVQPTVHGSYLVPMINPTPVSNVSSVPEVPPSMTAYEQNGTVYFYDPSQYGGETHPNENAYGASSTNSAAKPHANGMFYPSAPSNYYSSQQ